MAEASIGKSSTELNYLMLFSKAKGFQIQSQSAQFQKAFLASPLEGHFFLLLHIHQGSCLCHLFNSLTT